MVHAVPGRDTPIEVPEPMGVNQWRDSRGCRVQYSEDTDYFAVVEKPGRPAEAAAPPAGSPVLTDPTDDELEVVRHVVRELGRTHFIVGAALCPKPFPRPRFYGYADATRSEVEDWVDVYDDPDAIAESRLKAVTGPAVRRGIELAKREQIDAIAYGHDYGCSSGPFLSPELFRRAIFPALKVYADIVHSFGLLMVHHCCGYNLPLIDQMIEAGVDVYQSVQAEMDLAVLKKRYGANLAFWGGVPAGLLVTGTPDEVRAAGKKAIDIGKPGGGFIYSTSHSVMPGAKPENYRAMLDALAEHGAYR